MMLGYAMLVFTAYYIQGGASWLPIVVALPRILTVPALKLIRNFPDAKADAASGKRTSVVIFGKERMHYVYIALVSGAILSFAFAAIVLNSSFALFKIWPAVLNIWPAALFVQSMIPVLNGQWRERAGLEKACKKGFQALLLTPITLTLTFLLKGWLHF
jgi:1,4-dihydroxy-2-naphthoate octaprenyltransferase